MLYSVVLVLLCSLLRASPLAHSVSVLACGSPQPAGGSKTSCLYKIKRSVYGDWPARACWPNAVRCLVLWTQFCWGIHACPSCIHCAAFVLQTAGLSACDSYDSESYDSFSFPFNILNRGVDEDKKLRRKVTASSLIIAPCKDHMQMIC